jgi:hypothetical protein
MTLLQQIQALPQEVLATGNSQSIADALNVGRVKTVKVPIADVQAYLQTQGLWWAVKAVAADAAHPAQSAAVAVLDVAGARYENIDMTLPIVAQMLGGLVATSVITQAAMDDLTGMGVVPDPVSEFEVRVAIVADDGTLRI